MPIVVICKNKSFECMEGFFSKNAKFEKMPQGANNDGKLVYSPKGPKGPKGKAGFS
jgi:hypothetical protein